MTDTHGKITDEGVEQLKTRVGAYYKGGPAVLQVTKDLLVNYARGMGSVNPLFYDEEYARNTRYGGLIGFPTFLNVITHTSGTPVGGLPGVQSFHAGNDWRWYHAIRPGDRIGTTYKPFNVQKKTSEYAGTLVVVTIDAIYYNQRNQMIGRAKGWSIRTERKAARERGKYSGTEKPKYTVEQLKAIQEALAKEKEDLRLGTTRYWEDVEVGEELPTIVKGPLRMIDTALVDPGGAGNHYGAGAFVDGAHYYTMQEYRKYAGYAEPDPVTGIADHPHRGHWEDAMATFIAVPGAYDLAPQRTSWLAEVVTNWMGDNAFLRRLYAEIRRFNVEGDTTWVNSQVTKKWIEGKQHLVECEVKAVNQRDEVTAPARAEVVLPSRKNDYELPM